MKCIAATNLLQLSLSNYNSRETLACLHLLKQNADIETREGFVCFVRIADIDVHCSEGPLCSLSFESERYGPHAYHGDDIAF